MDYSLVVSYHAVPNNFSDVAKAVYLGTSNDGLQPYICSSQKQYYIVYMGIINFLQEWTCTKKKVQCVKCLECNNDIFPPVINQLTNYQIDHHIKQHINQTVTFFEATKPKPVQPGGVAPNHGHHG